MSDHDIAAQDLERPRGLTALIDALAKKRHLLLALYALVFTAYLTSAGLFNPLIVADICYNLIQVLRGVEDKWDWAVEPDSEFEIWNVLYPAAFVALQAGFLWGGGRIRIGGGRVRFRKVALSIVIISGLAALLTFSAIALIIEFGNIDEDKIYGTDFVVPGILIGSWIGWFVIIILSRGQGDHAQTLARPLAVLLAGSWLEFGVALPVELAKRDEECPCAVGSWIALVTVIPIIIWAFGPALYLLYQREKRLDEQSPGRARRILARKSSRRTAEEPAQ
jgi:hypothetical protein